MRSHAGAWERVQRVHLFSREAPIFSLQETSHWFDSQGIVGR